MPPSASYQEAPSYSHQNMFALQYNLITIILKTFTKFSMTIYTSFNAIL